MLHDLLPKTVEGALAVLGGWLGLIWSATLQNLQVVKRSLKAQKRSRHFS